MLSEPPYPLYPLPYALYLNGFYLPDALYSPILSTFPDARQPLNALHMVNHQENMQLPPHSS